MKKQQQEEEEEGGKEVLTVKVVDAEVVSA